MDPGPRSLTPWLAERVAAAPLDGVVDLGPTRVPVEWLRDPACYRDSLRRAAARALASAGATTSGRATAPPEYVPKVYAELEPLLALWPDVLLVPTTARLSMPDLIHARAWPVHPLGVVAGPTPADGAVRTPAEFFFHDLDHARFKVREDLLARGVEVPDPYVDGTTFDSSRGAHRAVMQAALPHVDDDGWRRGPARAAYATRLLAATAGLARAALGEAAVWLLFELVHEKSLPLERATLARELAKDTHVVKLRTKCERGFYRSYGPSAAAVAELDAACAALRSIVEDCA